LSNSRTNSSSSRTGSGGRAVIEEEAEEGLDEGVEVGGDGNWNAQETLSERGTACTEPHSTSLSSQPQPQPQSQAELPSTQQQQQLQPQSLSTSTTQGNGKNNMHHQSKQRKGNVQLQINGRYVPQLDMIFSSKRSGSSFGYGASNSEDEPSCRFVNGNGLRPATETLNLLVENGADDDGNDGLSDEQIMEEQNCTCHDSIRNSEHHLCTTQQTNNQTKNKPTTITTTTQRGSILTNGRNLLRYTLFSKKGVPLATAEAHLYLWKSTDSVIVSDVDGTVTKSDVRGVIDTVIQDRFEYCHGGICKFYQDILNGGGGSGDCREEDGVELVAQGSSSASQHQLNLPQSSLDRKENGGEIRFLYLSSRPIILVSQTRKLLLSLSQPCPSSKKKKTYGLPPGPILCHTGPLSSVLYAELVAKNIYEFKADVLARQVVLPFVAARGEDWKKSSSNPRNGSDSCVRGESSSSITEESGTNDLGGRSWSGMSEASSSLRNDDRLFLAGFGNKVTDAMAYEMAGIDRRDIYIIDKESRILCMGVDDEGDSMEEGKKERCSFDQSVSDNSALESRRCDETEWSLADGCCPGGVVEGTSRTLSGLATPVRVNNASSSSDTNKVASSIHSIELSLTEKRQSETSENLTTLSRTEVDIYVTNDQKYSSSTTAKPSSKRSKIKQSIRAFSSRKSLTKFPSLGSSVSSNASKSSSPKKRFEGYDDPLLLVRMRERMAG